MGKRDELFVLERNHFNVRISNEMSVVMHDNQFEIKCRLYESRSRNNVSIVTHEMYNMVGPRA